MFTDFKLYWERWGGYADRTVPFGEPTLLWVIAEGQQAAACSVTREPTGAAEVVWKAGWQRLPYALIDPLPALLEEAGAFADPVPLRSDPTDPTDRDFPYRGVEDLTGVVGQRPFRLSVEHRFASTTWTPVGERIWAALTQLALQVRRE